jgi:hypothetical protein
MSIELRLRKWFIELNFCFGKYHLITAINPFQWDVYIIKTGVCLGPLAIDWFSVEDTDWVKDWLK